MRHSMRSRPRLLYYQRLSEEVVWADSFRKRSRMIRMSGFVWLKWLHTHHHLAFIHVLIHRAETRATRIEKNGSMAFSCGFDGFAHPRRGVPIFSSSVSPTHSLRACNIQDHNPASVHLAVWSFLQSFLNCTMRFVCMTIRFNCTHCLHNILNRGANCNDLLRIDSIFQNFRSSCPIQ